MKTFIILNGKHLRLIERTSLADAKESAYNICDHSKEVIVREFDDITDHTKVFENQP
jgi:hypothetical protein